MSGFWYLIGQDNHVFSLYLRPRRWTPKEPVTMMLCVCVCVLEREEESVKGICPVSTRWWLLMIRCKEILDWKAFKYSDITSCYQESIMFWEMFQELTIS